MANSHNCASIYFQLPFSLPSPSSLLKFPNMALGVTSSPYINEKVNFLSFSGGLIGETIFDFLDKYNKNIIVPEFRKELTDILINFSIEWVRSLDPVRC